MERACNAIGRPDRMWWVAVMDVGLDPELTKVVRAFGSSYCPNREGI